MSGDGVLGHTPTRAERARFARRGYHVVRGALAPAELATLAAAFDASVAAALTAKGTSLAALERSSFDGGSGIKDGVDIAPGSGRWTHGGLPQRDPRFVLDEDMLADPRLAAFASSAPVLRLVEALLGGPARLGGADGHVFYGDTGWHPDAGWNPHEGHYAPEHVQLRVALYLEPVGPESGALRFIPGSNRSPLHDRLAEAWAAPRPGGRRGPPARRWLP